MIFKLEYLFTCILALLYTLFVSGRYGAMFLTVLIIMPIISIAVTRYSLKKIKYKVTSKAQPLNKGETTIYKIAFSGAGFMPMPYISVKFFCSAHFDAKSESEFLYTLSSKNVAQELECQYEAVVFGRGEIGLQYIKVSDFFGLKKYSIYDRMSQDCKEKCSTHFDIFPSVDTGRDASELVRYLSEEMATDDEEETNASITYGGLPGFEHKEYEPGDPLKRVNWKLSAKKETLMVRLSEKPLNMKINLIIELSGSGTDSKSERDVFLEQQRIAEALVATIEVIVLSGNRCNVTLPANGTFTCVQMACEADIRNLLQLLCAASDTENTQNMEAITLGDVAKLEGSKRIALFTVTTDIHKKLISDAGNNGYDIQLITLADAEALRPGNCWVVDDIGPIRPIRRM